MQKLSSQEASEYFINNKNLDPDNQGDTVISQIYGNTRRIQQFTAIEYSPDDKPFKIY